MIVCLEYLHIVSIVSLCYGLKFTAENIIEVPRNSCKLTYSIFVISIGRSEKSSTTTVDFSGCPNGV